MAIMNPEYEAGEHLCNHPAPRYPVHGYSISNLSNGRLDGSDVYVKGNSLYISQPTESI
ncbi:hypothetical protein FRC20_011150 [Serendipita sp. 405]|nr:hypothetical protein FRC20_011150 [Serendipita sp. 405]